MNASPASTPPAGLSHTPPRPPAMTPARSSRTSGNTLVRIAGRRCSIEEDIQSGEGRPGLDEHQVRTWTSWHRLVTLAMPAAAFLSVVAEHRQDLAPDGLILLTRNEIAMLFASLIIRPPAARATGCASQPGAVATNTGPRYAPAGGKKPKLMKIVIYGRTTTPL